MRILITGTPGTGKTILSKELSKLLNFKVINIKKIIKENKETISSKEKDNTLIINNKLINILKKIKEDNIIFETHLIEYAPKVDIIIILRTNPEILFNRLKKRKYSKEKIKENLECEILDYFLVKTKNKNIIEYDTSKGTIKDNAKKIFDLIQKKKFNKGRINWLNKKYLKFIN